MDPVPRLAHTVTNAVAVLIIVCPCAAGAGYAGFHHDGHRARRHDGCAVQERRGAGGDAHDRRGGHVSFSSVSVITNALRLRRVSL